MMRKASEAMAILALVALAVACGEKERGKDQLPISRSDLERGSLAVDEGEETYRRYCIGCHGADGKGNGGITGANFTAPDSPLLTRGDTELMASVRDGKRGATATMPAHGPVLNDAQIAQVLGYVRKHFAPATSPATTAEAPAAPATP
jgi:mono/diheme cytochrome c family protein